MMTYLAHGLRLVVVGVALTSHLLLHGLQLELQLQTQSVNLMTGKKNVDFQKVHHCFGF